MEWSAKSCVRSDGELKICNGCFFFWKIDNGQYYFRWVASTRVFFLNLTRGHASGSPGGGGGFRCSSFRDLGTVVRCAMSSAPFFRLDNCLRVSPRNLSHKSRSFIALAAHAYPNIRMCVDARRPYRTRHVVRNPNQIITATSVRANKSSTIDTLVL